MHRSARSRSCDYSWMGVVLMLPEPCGLRMEKGGYPKEFQCAPPRRRENNIAGQTQMRGDHFSPAPGTVGQPCPSGPLLGDVDRFGVCLYLRHINILLLLNLSKRQCGPVESTWTLNPDYLVQIICHPSMTSDESSLCLSFSFVKWGF